MKTGLWSVHSSIPVLAARRFLPAMALVLVAGLAVLPWRATAGPVFDDFESYAVGSNLHGQGGWAGWADNPSAGALVSSNFSFSPTRSVNITGDSDLVRTFSDATNGQWVFSVRQYIPSTSTGTNYVILLNTYRSPYGATDLNWSVQIQNDMAAGQIISDLGGGATRPMVKDQWVEVRCEINLDANSVSEFYNGQLLSTHAWQNGTGLNQIQAHDLFANNAEPVYYDNVSLVPCVAPSITSGLSNQTICVWSTLSLSVTASGTPPLSFQWQKNGMNLADATDTNFFGFSNAQLTDSGTYGVVVSNAWGSATSTAVVTVVQCAPIILLNGITNNGAAKNSIGVCFDRPLMPSSATDPTHYVVNAGTVGVTGAILRPDGRSVELTLASPAGEFFSVCVTNVLDVGSNAVTANATGFMSEYSSTTLGTPGDPQLPGQVYTCFWDTFDVTVDGSNIGGFSDHFHFIHQAVVGDFDMRVLVTRLDFADPLSKAGLMARESLAPESPTLQTYFTPTQGLNHIEATVRPAAGSGTFGFEIAPPAPANPLRWLRMTRTNDLFTTYHSPNGEDWILSGVITQPFHTNLFVGMAVSSNIPGIKTTASFTDFYVRGAKPGDEIRPHLSVSLNGTDVMVTWPRTPRDYAVEVSTNLSGATGTTDLPEWGLLVIPIQLTGSSGSSGSVWHMSLPLDLLGQKLFLRNTRVAKLIPDIESIMVTTGIILSPGSGLSTSGSSGTLSTCSAGILAGTAFTQTGSSIIFTNATSTASSIDTVNSSSGVNSVLRAYNTTSFAYSCNDDYSTLKTSKVFPLPSATATPTVRYYTFIAGAKSGLSPPPVTSVIQVYCTP